MSDPENTTDDGLNAAINRRIAEAIGRATMERIVAEARAQRLSDQLGQAYDGLRQAAAEMDAAKVAIAERDEARAEAEALGQELQTLKAAHKAAARPGGKT